MPAGKCDVATLSRMKNNNPEKQSSRGDNFLHFHQQFFEFHKKIKKLCRFEISICENVENFENFEIFGIFKISKFSIFHSRQKEIREF